MTAVSRFEVLQQEYVEALQAFDLLRVAGAAGKIASLLEEEASALRSQGLILNASVEEAKVGLWRTAEATALRQAADLPAMPAASESSSTSSVAACIAWELDEAIRRTWKDYRRSLEGGHGSSVLWTRIELLALVRVRRAGKELARSGS